MASQPLRRASPIVAQSVLQRPAAQRVVAPQFLAPAVLACWQYRPKALVERHAARVVQWERVKKSVLRHGAQTVKPEWLLPVSMMRMVLLQVREASVELLSVRPLGQVRARRAPEAQPVAQRVQQRLQ